jgi:hypothetical protein
MKKWVQSQEKIIKWIAVMLWLCIAGYTSMHHEIWRDEMRALSLAIQHNTFSELFQDLTNEGHPILWYLLLKGAYTILQDTIALKVVSLTIGFGSVVLFLFHFRLPMYIAILYCFSNIMIWENAVSCRNYGIATLLIIIFSILYDRRQYLIASIILGLLAQSNLIAVLVAMVLLVYMIFKKLQMREYKWLNFFCYSSIVLISIWFFYYTTKPDELSLVISFGDKNILTLMSHFFESLFYPSKVLHPFVPDMPIVSVIVIFLLTFYFIKDVWIAIFFYLSVVLLNFLCLEFPMISTRHIGVFFALMFFFIHEYHKKPIEGNRFSNLGYKLGSNILLPIMCIALVVSSTIMCHRDITSKMSNSKTLGDFIANKPKYKNAIVIFEADYAGEGLPYYVDNKIYIPRENRFGDYAHFTKENASKITLSEIIDKCDSLSKKYGEVCLFAINQPIVMDKDQNINIPFYVKKNLVVQQSDFLRLKLVAEFRDAYYDENFLVFEIK